MSDFRLSCVKGLFHVEWHDADGRHRHSLGTRDRQAANAAFIAFKRSYLVAASGTPSSINAIYEAYARDREDAQKPAAPRIRDAWKNLALTFSQLLAVQVTEDLCRSYTINRAAAGASMGTVHIELGYLRAALRFAFVKRRWIDHQPYVPLPQKPPPRDNWLTRDEARRLIAAAGKPHVRLFIILALATAGRAGALLDLTWSRVDFERRRIMLRDPAKPLTAKGRATVPMNQMLFDALHEAQKGAISAYVIEWGGEKVDSVKKAIARSGARAGLEDCTAHVLRHTAAVWMAEAGVSMEEIAQYLGHSNIETTRRVYARYSPDHLQRAARALEL
jgi:integrase